MAANVENGVGETIPPMTEHVSHFSIPFLHVLRLLQAVSVSLPTWKSNVGYEEGEQWVISKMKTGYPR
jgi:cystathionine gamma-synthase